MKYKDAGVDINKEEEFIKALVREIKYERKDFKKFPLNMSFTGMVEFGEHYMAMNTDGVGTKIIVAEQMKKWDTIGMDCIAMNVNDTITVGAEPVAFVDYLAISRYDTEIARDIGRGLNEGAKLANVTILGGETATIPEITNGIDLSGTSIGFVRKDKIISGERVKKGDLIFGIPSSGIHSNGLTLARRVLNMKEKMGNKRIGDVVLTPTRIYVRDVMNSIKNCDIHGMAHITGGGLKNILRIKKMRYIIESPLKPQRIFREIMERGNVSIHEMYQTYNMGMGFVIIAPEHCEPEIKNIIPDSRVVGQVEEGHGVEISEFGIRYV